jgi:protein MpaA
MRRVLASSREGREIEIHANFDLEGDFDRSRFTLIIGGTHGDEKATVPIIENFFRDFVESGKVGDPVVVIPLLNPDGHARGTRYNGAGVDLNRNFPHNWREASEEPPGTHALSEPEALALHDFILSLRPAKIVSLHWALAEIDADGLHSDALGRTMWEALGEGRKPYRLRTGGAPSPDACPGSLGQWCGFGPAFADGARPAMVTLELPYHPYPAPRPESLPDDHLEFVRFLWESRPEEYLAGVQGPVHAALEAACRHEHRTG